MKRALLCLIMLSMLSACGLKRNLELPNQEKYKHNCKLDDQGNKIDPNCKSGPAAKQNTPPPDVTSPATNATPPSSLSNPAIVPPISNSGQ